MPTTLVSPHASRHGRRQPTDIGLLSGWAAGRAALGRASGSLGEDDSTVLTIDPHESPSHRIGGDSLPRKRAGERLDEFELRPLLGQREAVEHWKVVV